MQKIELPERPKLLLNNTINNFILKSKSGWSRLQNIISHKEIIDTITYFLYAMAFF